MKTVLFLGTKIGCEALLTLIEMKETDLTVFVDSEHAHEKEKYANEIAGICKENGFEVIRDASLKNIEKYMLSIDVDLICCFGFRRILPELVIKRAKKTALSTHFGLLPEYRGFAPVNWAIINGESKCGVSLFHMAEEMDAGDLVAQREILIQPDDYVEDVLNKCIMGLKEILKVEWDHFRGGMIHRKPQDHSKASYTCSRNPKDGKINWYDNTDKIYCLIRGISSPFPGAFTYLDHKKLTIWSAEPFEAEKYIGRIPGKVIKILHGKGVVVLTKDGAILIKNIEVDGSNKIETADRLIRSVRVTLE